MIKKAHDNALSFVQGEGEEEMNIRECVTSLMMNMQPWTMGDLATALKSHSHIDELTMVVGKLEVDGVIKNAGRRGRVMCYTLVRENLARVYSTDNPTWRPKEENLQGLDPKGKIDLKEGLEVCIWKAMSDGKSRLPSDVVDIIATFGNVDRGAARLLFTKLIKSKTWFDQTRRAGKEYYSLKKTRECPGVVKAKETPKLNPLEIPPLSASTQETEEPNDPQEEPAVVKPAADVDPTASGGSPVQIPLEEGDTLKVRLWKVMHDRHEYTSSDLQTLLGDYSSNSNSVYAAINNCFNDGWFDRRDVNEGLGSPRYVYRLRENVPMPVRGRVAKLADVARIIDKTKKPETTQTNNQETKEDNAVAAYDQNLDMSAPLIEEVVRIKGIAFTKEMIGILLDQMERLHLDKPESIPQTFDLITVETKYSIHNTEFTRDELEQVYNHFKARRNLI
jgi:hypothetical protein